ncbi:MAG: MBL fold metallo-hydrolase [Oscillospiraceae bacterium]|nr:MBL fold metallo-hydrolase [Oscillospiraceae bacterium]
MKLIILGTGNAMVTHCYNTCFALQQDEEFLLVDAGGGNGILRQMEQAKLSFSHLHHLFLTHAHTDHLLGVVWVVRAVAETINKGKYEGELTVWCHDVSLNIVEPLCRALLPGKLGKHIGTRIHFVEIRPGDKLQCLGMDLTVFDIFSTKAKQYGFRAVLPDGQVLVCLGDEPCHPDCQDLARGCDWLLTEAFCLYDDRDIFRPYEKHHSTAKDGAALAQELGAKHLVLYHTEDKTIATRKARYTAEAQSVYAGAVFVPDDLDTIEL